MINTIKFIANTKYDDTVISGLIAKCKKIKCDHVEHMTYRIHVPQSGMFSAPMYNIDDIAIFLTHNGIYDDSHNIIAEYDYLFDDVSNGDDEPFICETITFTITTK